MTEERPEMDLHQLLGDDAEPLLTYECKGVHRDELVLPGPDFVDRVTSLSDRPVPVLRNLGLLLNNGRLGGTGYISILPVDQGIEHSAAASFAPNPIYFDPKNIVELAIESGCNAVASTLGVLGIVARRYAHKIPFIAKLNHNELLSYPNTYDQVMFGSVQEAFDLGAVGVGADRVLGLRGVSPGNAGGRRRPSRRRTRSGCSPSCGATCATTPSRKTASTTRFLPT